MESELKSADRTYSVSLDRVKSLIQSYAEKYNKFPTIPWVAEKLSASKGAVKRAFFKLETEGFIQRKHSARTMNSKKSKISMKERLVHDIKKTLSFSPGILFLKIVMLVVGTGAVYMSAYHSIDFLKEFYSNFRATLSGFIIVLFAVSAFDIAILFWKNGKNFLSVVFVVLWIVVTLFSMTSTVGGLYNSRALQLRSMYEDQTAGKADSLKIRLLYENILSREKEALSRIESERIKRDGLVTLINSYTEEMIKNDTTTYNRHCYRQYLADQALKGYEKTYNDILQEKKKFLEVNTISDDVDIFEQIPDFYQWIGGRVFKISPDMFQFWISCFPAIFYDIIAPLAFAVVIFVKNKNEKS